MQLHSQIDRQTWMKMIGTDNFAFFFFLFAGKRGREMKETGKTHTDSTL